MQNLGTFTDTDIQAEYTLYFGTIAEVKTLLTKAYGKIKPKDFTSDSYRPQDKLVEKDTAKTAGLYHNTFLVTQNLTTDNPLLLDGFTRLFMAYDKIASKEVFIKDYANLTDAQAMGLMAIINFWKTTESFVPLFDRGFTLYTFMKTGYNIKPHVNEHLIGYFDVKPPLFYEYGFSYCLTPDARMLFNNERVFDDMLAMCKLYDLRTTDGHPYAVPFNLVLHNYRLKEPSKIFDTDKLIEWIKANSKMTELGLKLKKSYNVTSKTTILTEGVQLVWRKFVLPVLFNEAEEKTLAEKKKEFQAMATKEKKKYKMVSFEDLINIPIGTEIYRINQDISSFKFEVTGETYLGHSVEKVDKTFALTNMARQQGKIHITTEYTYSFKKEDGTIHTREVCTNDWMFTQRELDYGTTMYVKK